LELINDESSEIVEIPRINVTEKIDIQLNLLSRMPGTYWHNELIQAVENQKDDHKFVLDTVLIENNNSAAIASYWDEFKLQTVTNYILAFRKVTNIENKSI
jgi:hypothetical protein